MKCALVIGGKVYVAWKRKMLHDVIGGHQAYIHEKIDLSLKKAVKIRVLYHGENCNIGQLISL